MKKKRSFAILSLIICLMFVIAGCGNANTSTSGTNNTKGNSTSNNKGKNDKNTNKKDDGKADETSKTDAADKAEEGVTEIIKAESPEKIPAQAKNRKDTLIVGITAPKGDFAPTYSSTVYDTDVCNLIFDGMVSNDVEGNPVPKLATWEISEDGKTYTFHLKEGVKFSDGADLTAEDVEFTFTSICDPNYDGLRTDSVQSLVGYKEYHDGDADKVEGIKVIDDYTISFTIEKVDAQAIWNFIYGIMDKDYYAFEKGDFKKFKDMLLKPIGQGEYILKGYKAGQEVSLEANPNYWQGEPKIKNIILKVTNSDTAMSELKAGGIDINKMSAKPQNINMLKAAGFLNLQLYPENGYGYIGWNLKNPLFEDKNVRQALTYGFDRKGFVDTYYKGYAGVCHAPISQVSWAYATDLNKYEYDPEKANKMLDEAGWKMGDDGFRYKDGKKFEIHWLTYTGSKYVETLIPILKDNWGKIGVDVIPELIEFATLCEKTYDKQEFEMYNMSWTLSIDPDPSGIFGKDQTELGGSNCVGWINEESEKLMDAGKLELNKEKRTEIYQEWARLYNEELPYLLLDAAKEMYAVSSRVKGLELSSYIEWTYNIHLLELEQ